VTEPSQPERITAGLAGTLEPLGASGFWGEVWLCRRSVRAKVEDNDPPVRILLERLGWPVPRALKRQVELRLFVSSPLFFFSLADLFDDERREHGSSSPGERWAFVFN
jgi:hypothetical protein